jgi:periplasmic copper chaperone A
MRFRLRPAIMMTLGLAYAFISSAATLDIRVEDAWIRWLPANLPAAGYVTLVNTGDRAEVFLGASSVDFRDVSLHQSRNNAGTMEMRPVDRIAIAPRSSMRLQEAGYHLMLMQPNRTLKPGDQVTMVLRFQGGTVTAQFEVRAPDSSRSP